MTKAQLYPIIGMTLMMGSMLLDSLFNVPDVIVIFTLALASLILWHGIRFQKGEVKEDEKKISSPMALRRLALLLSAFAFGTGFGFFQLRYSHPEQSLVLHVLISCGTFIFGAIFSYRQYFRLKAASRIHQNLDKDG